MTAAALDRLAEAAAARRAWMQYEPHIKEIIRDALTAGAEARTIARDLDVTESYVYRVWRDRPKGDEKPDAGRRKWAREYRKRHNGDAQ